MRNQQIISKMKDPGLPSCFLSKAKFLVEMRVLRGGPFTLYLCSHLSQLQQEVRCVMAWIKRATVLKESTLGK